jgi:hypothetical protein
MDWSPLTIGILYVAALLVLFRVWLSRNISKKDPHRRRGVFRGGPGAGASGAFHEMLNEDRRKAIEIILEEKAEARDPETADDTVKDEGPRDVQRGPRDTNP